MESARSGRAVDTMKDLQERLRVLSESVQSFADASMDPQSLLEIIVRRIAHVLKDSCSAFLLSETGQELLPAAVYMTDPDAQRLTEAMLAGYAIRVEEQAAARHVLESGKPLLVPQFQPDNGARSPAYADYMRRLGVHSLLLVPLRLRNQSIGLLALTRFRPNSPPFHESDRELAQLIAEHAALAIGNSRSYAAEHAARAQAEAATAALRESESMHRLLFEESPFPAFVFDAESEQVLHANEAALRLYGYTRDEFLRLRLADLRNVEDAPQMAAIFAAAGDADTSGAGRHRHKDGHTLYLEGKTHLSKFGGRPARFAVLLDVTERVLTRALLQGSESRFARLTESGVIGVFTCTLEGTIVDANATFLNLIGYASFELHAGLLRLPDLTPVEARPEYERHIEQLRLHGVVSPFEREYLHKSGERVPVLVGKARLDDANIIAFIVDLSEQKRSERALGQLAEQLRQSQKMEAVGRLAGGVAHDFNNILSVILSYGEMIRNGLPVGHQSRSDVEEVLTAASRASSLTRQLLMFSRQQVLEPKVLDLNTVLARTHNMLQRLVGEDVELVTTPEPGLGRVRVDPSSLDQALLNLVVNARDAMPRGGRLTIETANVQLDEAYAREHLDVQPGPYVMLAVTDTGIGMSQATIARAFEPFFTTKEHGKGTGLGLSTVFGITQQSGGSVWVYSEPGKGTTFKLYLPRVDVVADVDDCAARVMPGGTETILLAEDQQQVRVVARTILERNGYRVLEALDAYDALRIGRQHDGPIDLLLTDVVMPQMSGPELAKQLCATRPETRVLCMSGYTNDSIVRHGILESDMAYLQKPLRPEMLARRVREVLDGPPGLAVGARKSIQSSAFARAPGANDSQSPGGADELMLDPEV